MLVDIEVGESNQHQNEQGYTEGPVFHAGLRIEEALYALVKGPVGKHAIEQRGEDTH